MPLVRAEQLIDRARDSGNVEFLIEELEELQEDVFRLQCCCEPVQAGSPAGYVMISCHDGYSIYPSCLLMSQTLCQKSTVDKKVVEV